MDATILLQPLAAQLSDVSNAARVADLLAQAFQLGRDSMRPRWNSVASTSPPMAVGDYGWPESVAVLGRFRDGSVHSVRLQQVDEDCQPEWRTNCSENWMVGSALTHWTDMVVFEESVDGR